LNEHGFSPPIPLAAPAVAPWTPPADEKHDNQANKPN